MAPGPRRSTVESIPCALRITSDLRSSRPPPSPHACSGHARRRRPQLLAARRALRRRPAARPGRLGRGAARRPCLVPLAAAELRYCSPTPRSRATGDALGYAPLAQPALRDCDMGRWRGLTLGEAMAREPAAVDAWLADPCSAPHGGESLLAFITAGGRLAGHPPGRRRRPRSSPWPSPRRTGRARLRVEGATRRRTGTSTSARCRRSRSPAGPGAGTRSRLCRACPAADPLGVVLRLARSRAGLRRRPRAVGREDQFLGGTAHPPHRAPAVLLVHRELAPVEVRRARVVGDVRPVVRSRSWKGRPSENRTAAGARCRPAGIAACARRAVRCPAT